MKKSILSNPAFRYLFEVFIIVFSVTVSFYIQDELNERDKMELKNESLKGVLIDLDKDEEFYNAKYAKYFLNDNPEDDYWEDIDEVLNKEPKDSIELIEWWDRVQNTSREWMSLAKQHQKALDEQIKQDGKVVELNNRVS